MGREAHALLAGLFVVGLSLAAVAIGLWLGNVGAEYDSYVVVSRYPVSGLRLESTVFISRRRDRQSDSHRGRP